MRTALCIIAGIGLIVLVVLGLFSLPAQNGSVIKIKIGETPRFERGVLFILFRNLWL